MSDSQKISLLSLLFKKDDMLLLKNYRPLSLSNYDYKILAIILANRLHKVISLLISEDQTGYIKGRFIGTNIRLIQDIIDYTEVNNMSGAILQLDFQKAFDSLEWNFRFKALKKFNFGSSFIHWITVLYKNPVAYIKNNGWMSSPLKIHRSVKQG